MSQENYKKAFKDDLHDTVHSHLLDYKKLKRGIVKLHKLYVQGEGNESKQGDSSDQHSKLKNNRESMEKNLQFMRESLRKDQRSHKSDTMRLMKENVQLLEQINILKKEEHQCKINLEELKE